MNKKETNTKYYEFIDQNSSDTRDINIITDSQVLEKSCDSEPSKDNFETVFAENSFSCKLCKEIFSMLI